MKMPRLTRVKQLEHVPDPFLNCRSYGHSWLETNSSVVANSRGRIVEQTQHLVCTRCETEQVIVLEIPSFNVKKRNTRYQDGYLIHNHGRTLKPEVRREQLRRLYERDAVRMETTSE